MRKTLFKHCITHMGLFFLQSPTLAASSKLFLFCSLWVCLGKGVVVALSHWHHSFLHVISVINGGTKGCFHHTHMTLITNGALKTSKYLFQTNGSIVSYSIVMAKDIQCIYFLNIRSKSAWMETELQRAFTTFKDLLLLIYNPLNGSGIKSLNWTPECVTHRPPQFHMRSGWSGKGEKDRWAEKEPV